MNITFKSYIYINRFDTKIDTLCYTYFLENTEPSSNAQQQRKSTQTCPSIKQKQLEQKDQHLTTALITSVQQHRQLDKTQPNQLMVLTIF